MCCENVTQGRSESDWDGCACGAYSVRHLIAKVSGVTDCTSWKAKVKITYWEVIFGGARGSINARYSNPEKIVTYLQKAGKDVSKGKWNVKLMAMNQVPVSHYTKGFWKDAAVKTSTSGDGLAQVKGSSGDVVGVCVCLTTSGTLHYVAVAKEGSTLKYCDPYDGEWTDAKWSGHFLGPLGGKNSELMYGGVCIIVEF